MTHQSKNQGRGYVPAAMSNGATSRGMTPSLRKPCRVSMGMPICRRERLWSGRELIHVTERGENAPRSPKRDILGTRKDKSWIVPDIASRSCWTYPEAIEIASKAARILRNKLSGWFLGNSLEGAFQGSLKYVRMQHARAHAIDPVNYSSSNVDDLKAFDRIVQLHRPTLKSQKKRIIWGRVSATLLCREVWKTLSWA